MLVGYRSMVAAFKTGIASPASNSTRYKYRDTIGIGRNSIVKPHAANVKCKITVLQTDIE